VNNWIGLYTVRQAREPSLSIAAADITALLASRGWKRANVGARAALWSLPNTEYELYVPHSLKRDTLEWSGVLERLAAPHDENPLDLERSLEDKNFDTMRFRINATGESIPLSTAATVVNSAFGMIRAAATAARRPRQSIDGNYSKLGDAVANSARLAHTEIGSFVFPVRVHVAEPPPPPEEALEGVREVIPESDERRVTRTLAQALATFERQIVQAAKMPNRGTLLPVVYAGGTQELFAKVAGALAEPDIAFIETGFVWASAEPAPSDLPARVSIPSEARSLVVEAARLLAAPGKDPLRVVTGPIIRIEHEVDDPFGEIVIQAAPLGAGARRSRVEVRVRAQQLGELHEWMYAGTTVVVHGKVERRPGHYARLGGVGAPRMLSETIDGV
jgi:Ni,Fe-hydrogenase III small subunit